MPQKFSPRPPRSPIVYLEQAEPPADSFWARAQNLSSIENPLSAFRPPRALGKTFCGFCKECFENIPLNDTKRTHYRSGLQGLCRSANYCSLCNFYVRLVRARCGDTVFQEKPAFTVYTRNPNSQQAIARSIINIGFQIKGHCMLAMAFCPDSSTHLNNENIAYADTSIGDISNRSIWRRSQPTLQSRADLFQEWLKKCETEHPKCTQHKVRGLPTRLVQIDQSTGSNCIRLISLSDTSTSIPYAALSHCWGSSKSVFSTTTSNLDQCFTSIPMAKLPKNFTDAIQITKALGLTHLWIDSLCIIQDSEVDWATESARMDVVYQNAFVTIAASSSSDAHGGCFLDLDQGPFLRLRLPGSQFSSNKSRRVLKGTLRSAYASPHKVAGSPLNTRGWVFQEMVLSARILYFTQDQVYWQCLEAVESEDSTMLESGMNLCYSIGIQRESYGRLLLGSNLISESELVGLWWSWATDYSKRTFTKAEDKLYACAGITQFYQRLPGSSQIVLGLLHDQLLFDLQWTLDRLEPYRRIPKTNLPSWTWLGYAAPLSPMRLCVPDIGGPMQVQTEVISVEVVCSGRELSTPLEKAELRIRGRVIRVRVGDPNMMIGTEYGTTLIFPQGSQDVDEEQETVPYSVRAIFDDTTPPKDSEVYCLEMQMFLQIDEKSKYEPGTLLQESLVLTLTQKFLVLKCLDEKADIFERIGTGKASYDDVQDKSTPFDDTYLRLITLV